MPLPTDLLILTLSFIPQKQVYTIVPTIKERHDLSTKLLKKYQGCLFRTKIDYAMFYIHLMIEMSGSEVIIAEEFQRIINELR